MPKKRGVELHWVGVGTWKMPTKITDEVITGKHLDAWMLSCENLARSSETALNELKEEARLQQLTRLVQSVPLAQFQKSGGEEDTPRARGLLVAYRQQLIEAEELLRKSNKVVSKWIPRAIEYIGRVIGHWVGDTNAPSS